MSLILSHIRRLWAGESGFNTYKFCGRSKVQYNVFDRMPTELILDVASRLPYSCAASLALCNHRLFFALGASVFTVLNGDAAERKLFLLLLGKDLMGVYFCSRCGKLHVLAQPRKRKLTAKERYLRISESRCAAANLEDSAGDRNARSHGNNFTLEHVQIAINLFGHGLCAEGNRYLKCATITRPDIGTVGSLPWTWNFQIIQPRFVRDQIGVRTQTCMLFMQQQGFSLSGNLSSLINVCDHLGPQWSKDDLMGNLLQCRLRHLRAREASCSHCARLHHCRDCYTEVKVVTTTIRHKPRIYVLTITKWQYVGITAKVSCGKLIALQRPETDSSLGSAHVEVMGAFEKSGVTPYTSTWTRKQIMNAIKKKSDILGEA